MADSVQEYMKKQKTSEFAVKKVDSLIQYLSADDAKFIQGRLQAHIDNGAPQSLREPKKRKAKA